VGVAAMATGGPVARRHGLWGDGLVLAAAHLPVVLAVQLANVATLAETGGGPGPAWLVLLQLENLLAGALLVLATRLAGARTGGRLTLLGLLALLDLVVLADQLGYPLFFDHLKCSYAEEGLAGIGALADSVTALLHARQLPGLFLALAGLGFAGWWLLAPAPRAARAALERALCRFGRRPGPWVGLAGYAALAAWAAAAQGAGGIAHYPPAALASDCLQLNRSAVAAPLRPVSDYRRLRFGRLDAPPPIPGRPWRTASGRRPNVVLVVLESIGALQLLRDGRPRPELAPFLAALAEHAIVYDSLYVPYPATVLTNVAISTGGPTLGWGKVSELRRRYLAPTLVGELARAGYRTALYSSADLEFGNLGAFLRGLGYDELFDFGASPRGFQATRKANSWGGEDGDVLRLAALWAERQAAAGRPFYLRVQTNIAHHPYTTPAGYRTELVDPDPDKKRYLDSVRYLDSLLESFWQRLERAGIAENTVLVLTGDHGEAFGEWHRGNRLHRNHLYEENVRSFLMVVSRRHLARAVRIRTPVAAGDIAPTVLGLVGVPVPREMPGQDLGSGRYRPRMVFFHKNNHPETWGLRDGRWKYIATFSGEQVELYDLRTDPTEQRNLAAERPAQVAAYRDLAATWYLARNDEFMARIEGGQRQPRYASRPRDLATRGPKSLAVGYLDERRGGTFRVAARLNPREPVYAWTSWVSYREPTAVTYRWTAPDGSVHEQRARIGPDDVTTRVALDLPGPLAEGRWRLELVREGEAPLAADFEVSAAEPLHAAGRVPVRPEDIRPVAVAARGRERRVLAAGEPLPAEARLDLEIDWVAAPRPRMLELRWVSPRGGIFRYRARVPAGAAGTTVHHNGPYPMAPGVWWLTLWHDGVEIGSKLVRVAAPRGVALAAAGAPGRAE